MPMTRVSVLYLAFRAMGRMLCHMTAVQGEPRPSNLEQGWTVDDGTFGARLALVRQRMQWNIKEAARECGVPAASWGPWEAGSLPRRYTEICAKIAERTGADYMWLLTGPRGQKRTMASYPMPSSRMSELVSRPRDNRPNGHPGAVTSGGPGRTTYLSRGKRRERD
jgi:hypothetical protein